MTRTILALSFLLFAAAPSMADETQPHTIAVMGEAEMMLPPDYADIDVGVLTQAKTVGEALQANNARMSGVIDAVRKLGIKDDDIQTSTFRIYPKYQPVNRDDYEPDMLRPIIGYEVSNEVTITVSNMSKIARIVDASVEAGANSSGQIEFRLKDPTDAFDKARRAAVANAYHKAQVLTDAAHLTLGPALSVTDNDANSNYNGRAGTGLESVIVTSAKISTPILPGQIAIYSRVTVVYSTQ